VTYQPVTMPGQVTSAASRVKHAAALAFYGFSGVVFFDSSFLVTVPSGDSVTVCSFDLTVPSRLTLVDFSW